MLVFNALLTFFKSLQEIEKFINESEHGVIYFSLGSVANVSSMPDDMRKAFCDNFAKLKQRVLWKWELDEMTEKPDNVKIVKWMPQRDILGEIFCCFFKGGKPIRHHRLIKKKKGQSSGSRIL